MDIIVRQFNVIGLRAEFPKCFTKNVYVYVDSKDQQSLRMLARKKLRGFRARKAWSLKNTKRYCLICCELNKREEPPFMIRQEHCLHCGNCLRACPVGAVIRK